MGRQLNILFLADNSHPALSIVDHINAFPRYSRHKWYLLNPMYNLRAVGLDFGMFDMIAIHYSIAVLWDSFLPRRIREQVCSFRGPKIQFIQDEYRQVNAFAERIAELGIDTLFTLVRPDLVDKAYNQPCLRSVRKVSTLPGFIPERLALHPVRPISERQLHIAYRSRALPFWYGELGQDKVRIAQGVSERGRRNGLRYDISVREEDRVYGTRWIDFVTSAKAVLGTEGGSSIWDYTGQVQRKVEGFVEAHPNADFDTVSRRILHSHEGNVMYNTMSPRLFEAAALRTAMVMFPGWYNGVVEPHRHYIPLEKDFSNFDEVVEKLKDDNFVQDLVDRTYGEIVKPGKYSKEAFIRTVDQVVDETFEAHPASKIQKRPEELKHRGIKISVAIRTTLFVERRLGVILHLLSVFKRGLWRCAQISVAPGLSWTERVGRIYALGHRALSLLKCRLVSLIKAVYAKHPQVHGPYRAARKYWRGLAAEKAKNPNAKIRS